MRQITRGTTGGSILIFHVFVQDSTSTSGAGKASLAFGDFSCRYQRNGETLSGAITTQDITTLGTYQAPTNSGNVRVKAVDNTNAIGLYEVHIHEAWVDTTNTCTSLTIFLTASGAAPLVLQIPLVADSDQVAKPTNFASLSIDGSGRIDVAKAAGTAWNSGAITASTIASGALVTARSQGPASNRQEVKIGMTDYSILVFVPDPASTDGSGKTGLVAANITASYTRVETDNNVVTVDTTSSLNDLASLTAAHANWGWKEVSSSLQPGVYRLDLQDEVFAAGAWTATVYIMITSSEAAPVVIEFTLVPVQPIDGVNAHLIGGGAQGSCNICDTLSTMATYIDTEVAAILAKVNNLPSDPADASDIASAFTSLNAKVDVIDDFLDTEVAAIKAKTDLLNADIATWATRALTMIQLDGAAYEFTAAALEEAPAGGGGGGGSTAEDILNYDIDGDVSPLRSLASLIRLQLNEKTQRLDGTDVYIDISNDAASSTLFSIPLVSGSVAGPVIGTGSATE